MHYIKCGVNSSLLIILVAAGLWHLGSLFYHDIIHNEGDLQSYFCVIFLETRNHAHSHVTSGTLIDCALSLATRRTQMATELG